MYLWLLIILYLLFFCLFLGFVFDRKIFMVFFVKGIGLGVKCVIIFCLMIVEDIWSGI